MNKQDSVLEISEQNKSTNLLLYNNLAEIFSPDYYSKFKNNTNINEPSMSMSRISQLDKVSEDYSNNTDRQIIHISERLTSEIYRNHLLENRISAQEKLIQDLQEKLKSKELQLKDALQANQRLQTQTTQEQEKIKQYIIQNKELKLIINSLQDLKTETLQSSVECPSVKHFPLFREYRTKNNSNQYSSSKTAYTKVYTEDSQQILKDKIKEAIFFLNCKVDHEKRHLKNNDISKYNRSQSNFQSSVTHSPYPCQSNFIQNHSSHNKIQSTNKKLENTLILLKSIRLQCIQNTVSKKA